MFRNFRNTLNRFKLATTLNILGLGVVFSLTSLHEEERKITILVSSSGVLAILLSLMGIFGLVVSEMQYREKEIGTRKINGATTADILYLFNIRIRIRIVS